MAKSKMTRVMNIKTLAHMSNNNQHHADLSTNMFIISMANTIRNGKFIYGLLVMTLRD